MIKYKDYFKIIKILENELIIIDNFNKSLPNNYYIEHPLDNEYDIELYTQYAVNLKGNSYGWDYSDKDYDLYIEDGEYENGRYENERKSYQGYGYIGISFKDFKRYIAGKDIIKKLLEKYKKKRERDI